MRLSMPWLDGGVVWWLEGRAAESGRVALVRAQPGGAPVDVVPAELNVRTSVHEYGGGAYCVHGGVAYVSNFERSKEFYSKTLGWALGTDERDVAGFAFGDGYLVIHADDRPDDARRYPGGMHVAVKVADAAAEHARLRQLGVTVSDLAEYPWGERSFSFNDPDGYSWWFGQAMNEHK